MINKMWNLITWGLVFLLTAQAVWTFTHSNFNFGLVLVVGLALAAWILKLFWNPLSSFFLGTLAGKILLGLIALGTAAVLGILAFVVVSGYSRQPTQSQEIMIILGAGLRKDTPSLMLQCRLDKAYEYWQENPDVLIVTTGGQGRDESCPEGYAMKKYLVEKGIPAQQIISEEKSTSTEENFLFARQLLEQAGYSVDQPTVVVTNAFHCYRGREYARQAGFTQVTSLPAEIPVTAVLPSYLREVFAVLYYRVFKSSTTGWMAPMVGLMELNKKYFYPDK